MPHEWLKCWNSIKVLRWICNPQIRVRFSVLAPNAARRNTNKRWYNHLKEINRKELDALVNNHYLHNTHRGLVNRSGNTVGFYKTRNKRYIEDKYVDIARRLV